MAKQINFEKFLIIECTASELYAACGGHGICDYCARPQAKGYYIAVLNCWYCPECFEEWKQRAIWYAEDAEIECSNFEFYAPRLGVNVSKC